MIKHEKSLKEKCCKTPWRLQIIQLHIGHEKLLTDNKLSSVEFKNQNLLIPAKDSNTIQKCPYSKIGTENRFLNATSCLNSTRV